jgi:hypothetical protein
MRSWTGRVRWFSNLRYWFADQSFSAFAGDWDDMARGEGLILSTDEWMRLVLRRAD